MQSITEGIRYQVFVSSTFSDLKEERDKTLQAILECKAFPTGMELFPSADDEQFDFIKREIDSSDYYILIIAGRYGSTAEDGVSFTEKEFDYAVAQRKPVLSFLVKHPNKLAFDKCEADEHARQKLDAFREKARGSRLVKFFENPDELKGQVLQSLHYQFGVNPRRGWLPAGISSREDLEEIRELQARVIRLEAENTRLREVRNPTAELLAQGQDLATWNVQTSKFLAAPIGVGKKAPVFPFPEATLEVTWDEVLCALYPGGTSRVEERDVPARLFILLVEKFIPKGLDPIWRGLADANLGARHLIKLGSLDRVVADVHRQFTGLGIIEEVTETQHRPAAGGASFAISRDVWRLTRRGEEHVAVIIGFKHEQAGT